MAPCVGGLTRGTSGRAARSGPVESGFGGDLRLSVPIIEKPVNAPTFLEAVERALAAS